jgi:hypothetical protein
MQRRDVVVELLNSEGEKEWTFLLVCAVFKQGQGFKRGLLNESDRCFHITEALGSH